jgi:hypothetical protein
MNTIYNKRSILSRVDKFIESMPKGETIAQPEMARALKINPRVLSAWFKKHYLKGNTFKLSRKRVCGIVFYKKEVV